MHEYIVEVVFDQQVSAPSNVPMTVISAWSGFMAFASMNSPELLSMVKMGGAFTGIVPEAYPLCKRKSRNLRWSAHLHSICDSGDMVTKIPNSGTCKLLIGGFCNVRGERCRLSGQTPNA